jgi:hypothetical protein
VGLGPGQLHYPHSMLAALAARRRGMQNRPVLAGVQNAAIRAFEARRSAPLTAGTDAKQLRQEGKSFFPNFGTH